MKQQHKYMVLIIDIRISCSLVCFLRAGGTLKWIRMKGQVRGNLAIFLPATDPHKLQHRGGPEERFPCGVFYAFLGHHKTHTHIDFALP